MTPGMTSAGTSTPGTAGWSRRCERRVPDRLAAFGTSSPAGHRCAARWSMPRGWMSSTLHDQQVAAFTLSTLIGPVIGRVWVRSKSWMFWFVVDVFGAGNHLSLRPRGSPCRRGRRGKRGMSAPRTCRHASDRRADADLTADLVTLRSRDRGSERRRIEWNGWYDDMETLHRSRDGTEGTSNLR